MTVRLPVLPSAPTVPSRTAVRSRKRAFWGAKYLSFRCTHCGACCKDTIAPITGDDLARLVKGTGRPPHEIVDFYPASAFNDGGEGLVYTQLDAGAVTMGLRRKYDRRGEPVSCRFFIDDRCSVYDHRPITCRLWPFSVSVDARGRMNRLSVNDAVECAYELDGAVDREALTANWDRDDAQDVRWRRVVDRWNRLHAGGTRDQFFAFLGHPPAAPRR